MNLTDQHVLITGGTSGIGYELAKLFAADGYNLVIVGRNEQSLNKTASDLKKIHPINIVTITKDLFLPASSQEVYDEIKRQNILVTTLVNNAGQGLYGEFTDTPIDRELAIIQLNICSLISLTKLFLQDMLQRKNGKILNLSSVASKIPGPWQSVYHGTKAFVQSFTEAIRNELKDTGITVTALLPGATDTDFFRKAGMLDAKNVKEGKLADPAGVAKDGYEALMRGDDMVVSGFMNKVEVAMGNILPDSIVANQVNKQQSPVNENN